MINMQKLRREFMRWQILITLNNARASGGASESLILLVVASEYADATPLELRGELDYLEERGLVKIERQPSGKWHADISRAGIDVVEYTVDIDPGIARPRLTGL